jgi:HPt (histidine-containing phosphotransfer) domain-containing protein
MVEPSTNVVEQAAAPPLKKGEQALDLAHLGRMTFGDTNLERELLQLYARQAAMLLARMRANPAIAAACAHTIKGSSRGIGAWRVARMAEAVELTAAANGAADLDMVVDQLAVAIEEARLIIDELLRNTEPPQTQWPKAG